VDPSARGLGLGRDLVIAAEDASKDQDCSEIRLEVRKDNEEAIGLYESLGYRRFGVPHGLLRDHEDALRYRKSLAPQLGLDMVRVPYYAQTTDFTCGPAALMMAMGALEPDGPTPLDRKLELRLWARGDHHLHDGRARRLRAARASPCRPGTRLRRRGLRQRSPADSARLVRSPEKKEVMRLVRRT